MKYGIYYAYWEKQWGVDYKKYISKVAGLGFDALEISCAGIANLTDRQIAELNEEKEKAGIFLTGGYGPKASEDLSSSDPDVVENGFRFWKGTFEVLQKLGITSVGGGLYGCWPVDYSKPIDKERDLETSVRNMRRLADMAADYGITVLGMEVLNRHEGYLLNTCRECVDYVEAVGKGITTQIRKGEVRALVGENGAGKSTLIKCIMGVETPTEGKVEILSGGEWKQAKDAIEAKELGMHANYQNVNIARDLTVAENYFLGRYPKNKFGMVDWGTMNAESQKIIDKFQLGISPTATISSLPVAMQAMITISKISVNEDIKLVIFDEPTALLENEKVVTLFNYIRELKEAGVSIIYVSHRLEEIMEICDSVTIMKDGTYVETKPISEVDKDYLISKMVGRQMADIYNIEHQEPGEELLRVEHLTGDKFKDVSFSLHKGEILGFFGLVGAGRSEVMRAIFGVDKLHSGKVYIKGEEASIHSPGEAIKKGIGFLTEDRRTDGLALGQTIKLNINMYSYDLISKMGIIDLKKESARADEYVDKVLVKTPSTAQLVKNLSGGNQQKVVIAKLLCRDPDILIFDEPTVGVDVGAKDEIFKIIENLTKIGKGVIIVSSYLPEAMGLADRMVVMSEGHVSGMLGNDQLKQMQEEDVLRIASTIYTE